MSHEIYEEIEHDGWKPVLAGMRPSAPDMARMALEFAGRRAGNAELTLVFTDDARMRELNHDFRGQDKPTNVLSFPANDETDTDSPYLGDVVLALETILREAQEQKKTPAAHTAHLVVHGTLHLIGFDHMDDDEAEMMEHFERRILSGANISDPYL